MDNEKEVLIIEEPSNQIYIEGDYLYYTTNKGILNRYHLENASTEELLNNNVGLNYFYNNMIYYIDLNTNQLFEMNLKTNKITDLNVQINDKFILLKDKIYYTDQSNYLNYIDLKTKVNETLRKEICYIKTADEDNVYFIASNLLIQLKVNTMEHNVLFNVTDSYFTSPLPSHYLVHNDYLYLIKQTEIVKFKVTTKEIENTLDEKTPTIYFPNLIGDTIYYYSWKVDVANKKELYIKEQIKLF